MNLTDIHEIRDLLGRHGFHFSKSLGQNFLIADWVPKQIAESAHLGPGDGVLEIGPGIGCLTRELAQRAEKVVSVELDKTLLPVLAETLGDLPNTEVVSGDVMKLDLQDLLETHLPGLKPHVCANLPYNITTPVLTRILESGLFQSVTVMVQREVARRICAAPGTADYGAFTLLCQYHAECTSLFDVPAGCFLPPPKVTSSVLHMALRETPPVPAEPGILFPVVRAAFGQRRKTLLNALFSAYGTRYTKDQIREILTGCGLLENIRGEALSLEQFSDLAMQLR